MSNELDDDTACCDDCQEISLGFTVSEVVECGCPVCGSHNIRPYEEWVSDLPDVTED